MEKINSKMRQCGVCACWTKDGYHLPSGNRNPRTGETPCDNFICWRCTREAERNWFVKRQAALMEAGALLSLTAHEKLLDGLLAVRKKAVSGCELHPNETELSRGERDWARLCVERYAS